MMRPVDLAAEAQTGLKAAQKWIHHPEQRERMRPVVRQRLAVAEARLRERRAALIAPHKGGTP